MKINCKNCGDYMIIQNGIAESFSPAWKCRCGELIIPSQRSSFSAPLTLGCFNHPVLDGRLELKMFMPGKPIGEIGYPSGRVIDGNVVQLIDPTLEQKL